MPTGRFQFTIGRPFVIDIPGRIGDGFHVSQSGWPPMKPGQHKNDQNIARRARKNATHRLHYTFVYGQLDRKVIPETL